MPQPETPAAMGPALFVGLTVFMLATGKPVEHFANPAETMDMVSAAKSASALPGDAPIAPPVSPSLTQTPSSRQPDRLFARLPVRLQPDSTPTGSTAPNRVEASAAPYRIAAILQNDRLPALPAPLTAYFAGARPKTLRPLQTIEQAPSPASLTAPRPTVHPAPNLRAPEPSGFALRLPLPLAPVQSAIAAPLARPAPPPLPAPPPAGTRQIVNADAVHLRRAPNDRSRVIAQFDAGASGIVVTTRGNWTRMYFTDVIPPVSGWMYSIYLSAD